MIASFCNTLLVHIFNIDKNTPKTKFKWYNKNIGDFQMRKWLLKKYLLFILINLNILFDFMSDLSENSDIFVKIL